MLRVWLFGRVRFQADDGPVINIKPERAQRLLAWLALETRGEGQEAWPRPRTRIVRDLWGDSEAQRPENSLVQALRELHAALGPLSERYLIETPDGLGLSGNTWVDAVEFQTIAGDEPGQALRMSDRPFLEYVLRSGSAWDHGLRTAFEQERERLRERAAEAPGVSREPSPAAAPARPDARQTLRRLPRVQRPIGLIAALALILTVAALGASRVGILSTQNSTRVACPRSVTEPDPADDRVGRAEASGRGAQTLRPVQVGTRPAALAVAREGIWVAEREGLGLIDPQRNEQTTPIPVTGRAPSPKNAPYSIAVSKDRLWVARRDGYLVSIDRGTRERVPGAIRYGDGEGTVATGHGAVWVNNFQGDYDGSVTRIEPCTGRISRIRVGRSANTVLFAFGSLWVTNPVDRTVERIDPLKRRKIASVRGLTDPQDLVAADGQLWVTQYDKQTVRRINPETNRTVGKPIRVGPDPAALTAGAGAIWVPLYGNGTLTRIDLQSQRSKLQAVRPGQSPTDAIVAFGRIWAPNNDGHTVTPVRP